jgi:glutamate-ammonia-ligase adenylyltransferase
MQRLLDEIAFRDPARALGNITQLSRHLSPELQTRIQSRLTATACPDEALNSLERLHREQPEAFDRLVGNPLGLHYLVTIFSHSRFLSEALVRHPEWMDSLVASDDLGHLLSAEQYSELLEEYLNLRSAGEVLPSPLSLAVFRRQQLLRIVLRDVLGLGALSDATEEISNLADAILDVTYRRIRQDLVARYGKPYYQDANGESRECGFAIIALGKLGGKELNYSSDIDLMFVYSGNGQTGGSNSISNKEFFKKVATRLTDLLSTYTAEGLCYRVDLRLRPDGKLGEVCTSLDGAKSYYGSRARDWELQMLIKARVSAGDSRPGRELLDFVEPLIYSTTTDFSAVESVSATRVRIGERVAAKRSTSASLDIKLARGGIRDIEFLVQCLQRLHGGREPWVRHGGTLLALSRLRDKALLSVTEYSRLASAYQFLRILEHRLQFEEDRQIHTLPADPEALDALARKMPLGQIGGSSSAEMLLRQLNVHLEEVQEIYERVIHAQKPMYYSYSIAQAAPPSDGGLEMEPLSSPEPFASNLVRFLDERAPKLAATLSRSSLRRGRHHFEHYLERILTKREWLGWLDSDPTLAGYILDLFEHSPYFAEELIRNPELTEELRSLRGKPEHELRFTEIAAHAADPGELRRLFRREMLRIQSESVCLQVPIFTTLELTSDLADAVIAAAYRMAVEQIVATHPPASATYPPKNQMMVIALGRLGMREFDLASDADLVFALPDADATEQVFWTRVAERMINLITAYTGDGVMFAVDTRLRPNGRAGALVQAEAAYKEYFAKHAETWEGIAYMKSRAVAGDLDPATNFLHELQDVDWRRYGQSGRSRKQLAQMRMKLEKEQGSANPLKAGRGGYYDIDFPLMYLRLKGAGIFYKVLNTPARIDVVEKMGHLERADAQFLRDAATFYRAVDHGLRLSSGHAEGNLPNAESQLEVLTELVRRWTPDHLTDQHLKIELAQIQERTREFFDRVFK